MSQVGLRTLLSISIIGVGLLAIIGSGPEPKPPSPIAIIDSGPEPKPPPPKKNSCEGNEIFNNREWVVAGQDSSIPEDPFKVIINGNVCGTTKLLTFASRIAGTTQFPQVFVINSSGFLRLKTGADPTPPLLFGQSLVLGPAIFGTSASFPTTTLFFNPQLQTVSIDTSKLNADRTGTLLIKLIAEGTDLSASSTKTNQIMNLTWDIMLHEPTDAQTQIGVAGQFTFTEDVTPDPMRTSEFQSFRLLQISSLFIDNARHDVDALRYRDAGGLLELLYAPNMVSMLLPHNPTALDPATLIFDSLHTDDKGEPNGNTPSYRITMKQTTGPVTGTITPRAFFVATNDVNDDNLGAWLHQSPSQPTIHAGTTGRIEYSVVATTDPLPPLPPPHQNPPVLTIKVSPLETGNVTVPSYKKGDKVTITATPKPGWVFDHFEGGDISGLADSNAPLAHAHPLHVVADISKDYDKEKTFTLDGTNSVGTETKADIIMDSEKSITAIFKELAYHWSQKSGPTVNLINPTSSKPMFSVQDTSTGLYEFELVVGNGNTLSIPDRTSIRVFDVDVVSIDPVIGTNMQIETEQTVSMSIVYSGLPIGSEIHALLQASIIGKTPNEPLILPIPLDFNIAQGNKPNSDLGALLTFLVGYGDYLAFLAKTDTNQGSVSATIGFRPQKLSKNLDPA